MTEESRVMIAEINRLIDRDSQYEMLVASCRNVVINLGDNDRGNVTPRCVDGEYPSMSVANAFFAAKHVLVHLRESLEVVMVDGA